MNKENSEKCKNIAHFIGNSLVKANKYLKLIEGTANDIKKFQKIIKTNK